MLKFFNNGGYFFSEVKRLIQLNLLSNLLSFFSTALIFFLLTLVVSGGWISNRVIEVIQGEAEINIFFRDDMDEREAIRLVEEISDLTGVQKAQLVDKNEAYQRMVEILGKESEVWEFFDDNPFSPFIEVKIDLAQIDVVRKNLGLITGIEHVRDNKEILEQLKNISGATRFLGYLFIIAVGISTVVIISHIIRLGVDQNKEQITTLRLLGAPETFIALPFFIEGLLITLSGGILALGLSVFTLKQIYLQVAGALPFLPLSPLNSLITNLMFLISALGVILGLLGSLFGLLASEKR
ncbi:MAG: cell division protein FtsX [Bacillota bacterium]